MLCLTCHQPGCENLPHLHYRTFPATLTNTRTVCPARPSIPRTSFFHLEHERRGHKAGSGKQSPARPAPGEGGQAPPAARQVSLFVFMHFHLFLFHLAPIPSQSLRSTSLPSPLHPFSPFNPLTPSSRHPPSPYVQHTARLSSAVLDSTVWRLSACRRTLLQHTSSP